MTGNENIKERLYRYLEFKGITPSRFEKTIKAGGSYLKNVKTIGSDKLLAISENYADLNLDWLITGREPMETYKIGVTDETESVTLPKSVFALLEKQLSEKAEIISSQQREKLELNELLRISLSSVGKTDTVANAQTAHAGS